jgi:hypothetical protein
LLLQAAAQLLYQCDVIGLRAGLRHDIAHESLVASSLAHDNHRIAYRFMPEQHTLDFAKLDAEAPHLYLMIQTSQVFERAIWPPSRQISRPIDTCARLGVEGMRNKSRCRQACPLEISTSQANASDMQLTYRA